MQEIYTVGVPSNSHIRYKCTNAELYAKDFVGNSDIYRFYLTDENGKPIDTNGLNMNFTICIYCDNDINKKIEKFIEMTNIKQYLKLKN